jgi:hypothetical protein
MKNVQLLGLGAEGYLPHINGLTDARTTADYQSDIILGHFCYDFEVRIFPLLFDGTLNL